MKEYCQDQSYGKQSTAWPGILFGIASVILFQAYFGFLRLNELFPSALPLGLAGVIAICAASSFLTYTGIPSSLATFMRGLAIACAFYNILQFPSIPAIVKDFDGFAQPLLMAAWMAAGIAAVLAFWRPSWLLLCGFYPYWIKSVTGYITGFEYQPLEILPLYQIPAYTSIALVTLQVMFLSRINLFQRVSNALRHSSVDPYRVILIIAIAVQSANYFYSGLAKAKLDGGLLDWVLHNETQNIFFVALYNKQLPWGDWSGLVPLVSEFFRFAGRPFAIAVFALQLCAVLAFTNRRLLLLLFGFFDLMHLGIFASIGANFSTWFMVNLAIIAGVRKLPDEMFGWKTGVAGALMIIAATSYASVARLGWYDTLAVNSAYFEVLHEDGRRTRVPRTIFGYYTYPIAHMSFGFPPGNYLPTGINGGTLSSSIHHQARRCDFDTQDSIFETRWNGYAVSSLIRGFHQQILSKIGDDGRWSNDLSLYHFAAAPSVVRDFATVDMRQVSAYILVIDSVCLVPETGAVARKVHHNEFRINVNK